MFSIIGNEMIVRNIHMEVLTYLLTLLVTMAMMAVQVEVLTKRKRTAIKWYRVRIRM